MAFAADSHVRWMHSEDYCSFEDIVVTTKRHRRCHVAAAIAAAAAAQPLLPPGRRRRRLGRRATAAYTILVRTMYVNVVSAKGQWSI